MGLAAHTRLHNNGTPDRKQTLTPTQIDPNYEEFPCKICGKYDILTAIYLICGVWTTCG